MSFESDHRLSHDLLPQYVAGTVPHETRQRIATHLEGCAVCREALEEWRVIVSGLRHEMTRKPPDTASDQTWAALHAQLHSLSEDRRFSMHDISSSADVELPAAVPVVPSSPRRRWMSFASVAAVAVIILVSVVLFNTLGKAHPPVGRSSATPTLGTSGCKTPSQAKLPHYTLLNRMSFVTSDDGWAVGLKFDDKNHLAPLTGVIYHFQQCQWQPYPISLPRIALNSVAMVSADEGWAAGGVYKDGVYSTDHQQSLVVLHYQNGQWRRVTIPGAGSFINGAITMLSAQEGWLFGFDAQDNSILLHYSNGTWSPASLPADIYQAIQGTITPVGTDDIWFAIGTALPADGDFTSAIVHSRHGQVTSYPLPNDTSVRSLAFPKPDDGWMAGYVGNAHNGNVPQMPVLMHFDGTHWANVSVPFSTPSVANSVGAYFTAMSLTSAEEGFIIGYMPGAFDPDSPIILYHLHHGQWQTYNLPVLAAIEHASATTVEMASANEGWAFVSLPTAIQVGSVGYVKPSSVILHYLNGTWSVYEQ